jgi:glycosyltransferase involved in cell wall biosynthesis
VRNGTRSLPALLDALAAQTLPAHAVEVVVVDDASTDGTAALVAADRSARLVRLPRRAGSYAARNHGAAVARAPVLAFTDADCRPAPDWLERGLVALRDADLVAGAVELPLGPRPTLAAALDVACGLDQARYVARATRPRRTC